jgi:hypothetical protein
MKTVYKDAFDIDGAPLAVNDHAVVVLTPHASSVEWVGHIVQIETIQQAGNGTWSARMRMLYANPGSTWGVPALCLRRIDKDSAEYAMAEATDRQYRASVLSAKAESIAQEARNEMFVAQLCWTRAASIKAMGG